MGRFEPNPAFEREFADALAPVLEAMGRASVREARRNTPVRTGQARASVEFEVDRAESVMRFGSRLLKYRFLEIGTVHMAPRAPLRRTLDEMGATYRGILERGR